MKILGIDPGYGQCGWAILEKPEKLKINHQTSNIRNNNFGQQKSKSEIQLLACDCIETDKNKDLPERLQEIFEAIEYVIKKYKPKETAIESLFFFKNQKTAMAVAQARGAIIVSAKKLGLDIYEYTPLQVKQSVIGYGRGDKKQIQQMIKLHLGGQVMPKQDDTADAVAVALTHIQSRKINSIFKQYKA